MQRILVTFIEAPTERLRALHNTTLFRGDFWDTHRIAAIMTTIRPETAYMDVLHPPLSIRPLQTYMSSHTHLRCVRYVRRSQFSAFSGRLVRGPGPRSCLSHDGPRAFVIETSMSYQFDRPLNNVELQKNNFWFPLFVPLAALHHIALESFGLIYLDSRSKRCCVTWTSCSTSLLASDVPEQKQKRRMPSSETSK